MIPIYEGKAKRLYTTDDPNVVRMEFKDEATAFNAEKKAVFADKGRLNKAVTLALYQMLESAGVRTHLFADQDEINLLVKRVEIVQIELVVRNYVAGSLQKRTGLPEGHQLRQPIVETYYKDDSLGDPIINDEHIRELELATPDEIKVMHAAGLEVNRIMTSFFEKAGMKLIDFKLEYGRLLPDKTEIVLADEISPDTCRLWDLKTGEKMDKDRFRQDLGQVMEKYAEVLNRVENAIGN
ncbi:MAG: phosphoribosylaminoimidazole-succinocarboxamide synthase [Verrucomicrobiales bacterium]|jgi:phosphoribosylaminoimidazole-succinocarboxamide synthase